VKKSVADVVAGCREEEKYLNRGSSEITSHFACDGGPVETGGGEVGDDNEEEVSLCGVVPSDAIAVWLSFRHGGWG
jgi:hypothetical protein